MVEEHAQKGKENWLDKLHAPDTAHFNATVLCDLRQDFERAE